MNAPGSGVITHPSFEKAQALLKETDQWQLKVLLEYWLSIHPQTHLPGRQHFDPLNIPKILPYITLLDVEWDPFRLRFRVLGTAVNHAFGRDFTGKYFDEEFPDYEIAVGYKQRFEVAKTGMPMHYSGRGTLRYDLDFKTIEWVLLPMARDGETVDMILSVISYGSE